MTDKRTLQQNKAEHVLFRQYAKALNDAGFDQVAVLEKKALPTPNTEESIKGIWKSIQAAMYPPEEGEKVSTTKLSTTQTQHVYLVLHKFMAENFGISIEWPSDEPPLI